MFNPNYQRSETSATNAINSRFGFSQTLKRKMPTNVPDYYNSRNSIFTNEPNVTYNKNNCQTDDEIEIIRHIPAKRPRTDYNHNGKSGIL